MGNPWREYRPRTRRPKNPTRTTVRENHDVRFIGVDGEGVTDPVSGEHSYVLLTVGDYPSLTNGGGHLHIDSVLAYLWDCFRDSPDAAFVGFFLGYDFTQWFRTLPEDVARELLTKRGIAARRRTINGINVPPRPVAYGDWELDILGSKRFRLSKVGESGMMYICDAGAFYQTSFLNAIDPKGWDGHAIVSPEEYDVIRTGKQSRGSAGLDADMVRYNVLENRVLARLMESLNQGFTASGVRLSRNQWFGPGQAAQRWLGNINAPTREDIEAVTPRRVLDAAQATYYGGWFEIFAHGPIEGDTHEYDINSAYPYAISKLPDFRSGVWDDGIGVPPESEYCIAHVRVQGSDSWVGPLPYRTQHGKILRPLKLAGWYWTHEIDAAIRAKLVKREDVTYHRWYRFTPTAQYFPFIDIANLYHRRLEVGKNTPAGKALKLMYNSAYGKTAQSIGVPKFASALHASFITSFCRTMILDAIATHPRGTDALLMVATDGIYFDSPHPHLHISETRLGAWDHTVKQNLSLFMPGVYWDDESRDRVRRNAGIKVKSRGVSAADLATQILACDDAWQAFEGTGEWPVMNIPLRFDMITATQALARGKWELAGTVRTERDGIIKSLSSDPSAKRIPLISIRHGRYVSMPYTEGPTPESTPYSERFGRELELASLAETIDAESQTAIQAIRTVMTEE